MPRWPKPRRNARNWLRCPDCDRYLPPDAFRRESRSRAGRDAYCRACRVSRDKATYNSLASDPKRLARRHRSQRAWWRRRRAETRAERLAIVRAADDHLAATGLIQRERAARLGVSVQTLINWRAGRVCPEPAAVERCLAVIRRGGQP